MEAGKRPLLIGAGAAVVAIIAAVVIVRGSPQTIVGETEAGATVASASASPVASASASASGEPMASAAPSSEPASSAIPAAATAGPHPTNTPREAGAPDAAVSPNAGADAGAEAGASRPAVVRIDESNEGKVIELGPGQQLLATLNANPTTGFDWAVIKAPAAMGAPAMGYVSSGDVPGAPGKRHLTWTLRSALPAGEQSVELGYARSFEKGVPPFKTFRFKVRGRP